MPGLEASIPQNPNCLNLECRALAKGGFEKSKQRHQPRLGGSEDVGLLELGERGKDRIIVDFGGARIRLGRRDSALRQLIQQHPVLVLGL